MHEINGFASDVDYKEFLRVYHRGTPEEKAAHGHWHKPGDGWFRIAYHAHRRHVSLITAAFFTASLTVWIVIWIVVSAGSNFWKSNCELCSSALILRR